RRVGTDAFGSAFFPAGRIVRQQAWMRKRARPISINAAPILVFVFVVVVFAFWKIEQRPVARRLVGLDARPADLFRQQAADRKRVVANDLRIEMKTPLVRQQSIVRIE